MNHSTQSDPFTETPVHQQSTMAPQQAPSGAAPYLGSGATQTPEAAPTDWNAAFRGGYGGGAMPGYGMGMANAYNAPTMGGAYAGMYGANYWNGAYAMPYGANYGVSRQGAMNGPPGASGAREAGAAVLSGVHDALSRFARVSGMIEEVLRNLHMLFDAVFGLGYNLGVLRQEARFWVALKTGPVGFVVRVLRRAANVWRLLCLYFMSPMAGRFSPVALVLRILGLVPEDDPLDFAWPPRRDTAVVEEVGPAMDERPAQDDVWENNAELPSDNSNM